MSEQFDPLPSEFFDFPSLISEAVNKAVREENEALRKLIEIAAADETKPGILISADVVSGVADTIVMERTIAFSDDVPRGEVLYAPMPTNWLKP